MLITDDLTRYFDSDYLEYEVKYHNRVSHDAWTQLCNTDEPLPDQTSEVYRKCMLALRKFDLSPMV